MGFIERLPLFNKVVQLGIFHLDWSQYTKMHPAVRQISRFKELLENKKLEEMNQGERSADSMLLELIELDSEAQKQLIFHFISQQISKMLRIEPSKITLHTDVSHLGLDSLRITELRSIILAKLNVEMKVVDLMRRVTFEELVDLIYKQINTMFAEMIHEQTN